MAGLESRIRPRSDDDDAFPYLKELIYLKVLSKTRRLTQLVSRYSLGIFLQITCIHLHNMKLEQGPSA